MYADPDDHAPKGGYNPVLFGLQKPAAGELGAKYDLTTRGSVQTWFAARYFAGYLQLVRPILQQRMQPATCLAEHATRPKIRSDRIKTSNPSHKRTVAIQAAAMPLLCARGTRYQVYNGGGIFFRSVTYGPHVLRNLCWFVVI